MALSAVDAALMPVIAIQRNVFSRQQVYDAGGNPTLIRRRKRQGVWCEVAPNVLVLAGTKLTWWTRLWVAVLAGGPAAVVSFEAAAALYELRDFRHTKVVVSVRRGHHVCVDGVTVHQMTDVDTIDRCEVNGLPATTPVRTAVDLAMVLGYKRLRDTCDDMVAAKLASYIDIVDRMIELKRPGKRGLKKLEAVLATRADDYVPPESVLERDALRMLDRFGEPSPVCQYPFPGREFVTGRVDLTYVEAKFIIEVDGRRHHTGEADAIRDADRDADAAAVGWQVLRIRWKHIHEDPEGTVRKIRAVRELRTKLFAV